MRPFDAILFDLGGTLTYFVGDWDSVIKQAESALYNSLLENGLDLKPSFIPVFHNKLLNYYRERETNLVEISTITLLERLLAEWGYTNLDSRILKRVLGSYYRVTQAHWFLDDDAIEVLEYLQTRGYRLGLISNASDDADVQTQIDNAKIRGYFEEICTSASERVRKPDVRIFEIVLNRLGVVPERAAMVGDTLRADILGAKDAGLYAIWITKWADTMFNRADAHRISPDAKLKSLRSMPELLQALT